MGNLIPGRLDGNYRGFMSGDLSPAHVKYQVADGEVCFNFVTGCDGFASVT